MMKITGARWSASSKTFCTGFSDGIILCTTENHTLVNMISVGLESYFLRKGKWPSKTNLGKRILLSEAWITKNSKRYKKQ